MSGFPSQYFRAESIRMLGESVDGADCLLSNSIPFLAVCYHFRDSGKLLKYGMIVWKLGQLGSSLLSLASRWVYTTQCNTGVFCKLQIFSTKTAKSKPQHRFH